MASNLYTYETVVVQVLAVLPLVGLPAGGTAVVISGRGFQAGATVTFGGVAATGVAVADATRITCTTPAHAAGPVNVVVTNPDTTTATLTNGFTYQSAAPQQTVSYRQGSTLSTKMRRVGDPPKISQRLGQPSTMTFTTPLQPDAKSLVDFSVQGVSLFTGVIAKALATTEGKAKNTLWKVACVDFWEKLSRTYPVGTWIDQSASTVLTALMTSAPGFSSVIEAGLTKVTVRATGTTDLASVIRKVCDDAGATAFLDNLTLHVFTTDSGFDPPATVSDTNPDLIYPTGDDAVTCELDYTQIANRITAYGAGVSATVDDPASQATYDVIAYPISDSKWTTLDEVVFAAQAELAKRKDPIQVVKYATRDLKTKAGKTVTVNVSKPIVNGAPLSGTFIIESVEIDQFEIDRTMKKKPRFKVTAKPASVPLMRPTTYLSGLLQTVVDLATKANTAPRLTGDVTNTPGGTTAIPAGTITAAQLAGCIPSSKLLARPHDEVAGGAVNGSNTHFTTANTYAAGTLRAMINGIRQAKVNVTETGPTTFDLVPAPQSGDLVSVDYDQ